MLAILKRPQGRKGELLAELLTDFPSRFSGHPRVFLGKPGFAGPETAAQAITITGYWLPVGRNHGRVVLAFAGVETISQAEKLCGLEVIVPADERVPLDDDAKYISDLVGCQVFAQNADQRVLLGTVEAVDFPTSADGLRRIEDAAPLLTVLSPAGEEILIPYVQAFLVSVSTESKTIEMQLPEGLIELNVRGAEDETEMRSEEDRLDAETASEIGRR